MSDPLHASTETACLSHSTAYGGYGISDPVIPALFGDLSHDLILICDRHGLIREANLRSRQLLGEDIIGSPLLQLLSTMSHIKGNDFLQQITTLSPGATSDTWELLFDSADAAPLCVSIRAGALSPDYRVLIGGYEPPRLTTLYHEVLAINSELTNIIRQLSKEQARLRDQIERLISINRE